MKNIKSKLKSRLQVNKKSDKKKNYKILTSLKKKKKLLQDNLLNDRQKQLIKEKQLREKSIRLLKVKTDEDKELEDIIFGKNFLKKSSDKSDNDDDSSLESDNESIKAKDVNFQNVESKKINSMSVDGNDNNSLLRKKFESVMGNPQWHMTNKTKKKNHGNLDEDDDDNDDDEDNDDDYDLLQEAGSYLKKTKNVLSKGVISFKQLYDANKEKRCRSELSSVEFHPSAQMLLTSGLGNDLNLFEIDGKINPLIQSIDIKKIQIRQSCFTKNGQEIFIGTRKNDFYSYDMIAGKISRNGHLNIKRGNKQFDATLLKASPCGKYFVIKGINGYMHIVTSNTKELIDSLKMNCAVNDFGFSKNGSKLYSCGDNGELYFWDMNSRSCYKRFSDDGSLSTTSIAASTNGQYLACGSSSGVVNIYEDIDKPGNLVPIKSLMNLRTSCEILKFNNKSDILVAASKSIENACRLIHTESWTVFSNFPIFHKPIKTVKCLDFSLNSGYLCIGNDKSRALLFRLNAFPSY